MQSASSTAIDRVHLYHPTGLGGPAFLTVWLRGGARASVRLDPRIAAILHALYQARWDDRHIEPAAARGWRSRRQLAKRLEVRTDYLVNDETITAYLSRLQRSLAAAIRKVAKHETVELLEHERGLGIRLAEGIVLEIVDGSHRDEPGPSADITNSNPHPPPPDRGADSG